MIYIYNIYVYINISSRSSFDLSCNDQLSKSETAAVRRLILYIYIIEFITTWFDVTKPRKTC